MTDLLTAVQAASIVGCSRETIIRNLTPVIPSDKGSAHLFNRADVDEFNRTWTRGIKQPLKDEHKRYVINPTSHTRQRPQLTPDEWEQVRRRARLAMNIELLEASK